MTPTGVEAWLDAAHTLGLNVVGGIRSLWGDIPAIQARAQFYDSHPGVTGVFLYDEPDINELAECLEAYNAIKAITSKPVSIVSPRVNDSIALRDAYDHLMADWYPRDYPGTPAYEFDYVDDYKTFVDASSSAAATYGKTWSAVLGAMGRQENVEVFRLLTYQETKFQLYYAIAKGATNTVFWARYRSVLTPATPDDPYPYSGPQWIDDVFEPLADEINTIRHAIGAGSGDGQVSDNSSDVSSKVYQDPNTGKYYLLTLNETAGSETTTFTVNLDPPGEKFISANPLFEGAQPVIPIIGTQFSDTFAEYEVHVYELTKMLLGDANGDGTVSADDYASVQAGFGDTGAPGLPGDANGTGTVSADDYASVQSNFGSTGGMGSVPVPEPSALSLLAICGLAVISRGRKRMVNVQRHL